MIDSDFGEICWKMEIRNFKSDFKICLCPPNLEAKGKKMPKDADCVETGGARIHLRRGTL